MLPVLLTMWIAVVAPPASPQTRAPVPDRLIRAKTVYLVNDSGSLKAFDKFFEEMSKWGRFVVVQDKSKADVVAVLTSSGELSYTVAMGFGMAMSAPGGSAYIHLKIFDTKTADILWSDSTTRRVGAGYAPAFLVSNLKKRMPPNTEEKAVRLEAEPSLTMYSSGAPLTEFFDAIPDGTSSSVSLEGVRIELKGCFGASTAREVLICVCDLRPTGNDAQVEIAFSGAKLVGGGGAYAPADAVTDLQGIFSFSTGQPAIGSVRQGKVTRLYFRFQSSAAHRDVPVFLQVDASAGAPTGFDSYRFQPTTVMPVDPTTDPKVRALFTIR